MFYSPPCLLAVIGIAVIAMLMHGNGVHSHQDGSPGDVIKHHGKKLNVHAPTSMKISDPNHIWGGQQLPNMPGGTTGLPGGSIGGGSIAPICDCHCECDYQLPTTGKPMCQCSCDCHPPGVPSGVSVPVPTSALPPLNMPAAAPALAPAIGHLPTHHKRVPPFDVPSYLPSAPTEQGPTAAMPSKESPPLAPTTITTYPPKPEPPFKEAPPNKAAPPSKSAPTGR